MYDKPIAIAYEIQEIKHARMSSLSYEFQSSNTIATTNAAGTVLPSTHLVSFGMVYAHLSCTGTHGHLRYTQEMPWTLAKILVYGFKLYKEQL